VTATLADLYMRQGHYAQAIEVLEALLLANPQRDDLARKLARAKALRDEDGAPTAPPAARKARAAEAPVSRAAERLETLLARVERRRRR
jgi:predicted Zn-dependent protease